MHEVVGSAEGEAAAAERRAWTSRRDREIYNTTKQIFLELVNISAKRSYFHNIWTSSSQNRALFYVRTARQMYGMVRGSWEGLTFIEDEILQRQFDAWRLHLCRFSLVPQSVVVQSLAFVLSDCLGDDTGYRAPAPGPSQLDPARKFYRPIKSEYTVGASIAWSEDGDLDAAERLLERRMTDAFSFADPGKGTAHLAVIRIPQA